LVQVFSLAFSHRSHFSGSRLVSRQEPSGLDCLDRYLHRGIQLDHWRWALNQPMPPAGVMWFAFGSAFLLIWAIMEPPGTAGLWQTNGSPKEPPDQGGTHDAA
jgi:hypothetical protein